MVYETRVVKISDCNPAKKLKKFNCTMPEKKCKLKTKQRQLSYTQVYPELGQLFDQACEKVGNGFKLLAIFAKSTILDVLQIS